MTVATPTVPDLIADAAILLKERVGCCLHVALDDGNVDTASAMFCLDAARQAGHERCVYVAEAMLTMSKTQRLKLGCKASDIAYLNDPSAACRIYGINPAEVGREGVPCTWTVTRHPKFKIGG